MLTKGSQIKFHASSSLSFDDKRTYTHIICVISLYEDNDLIMIQLKFLWIQIIEQSKVLFLIIANFFMTIHQIGSPLSLVSRR